MCAITPGIKAAINMWDPNGATGLAAVVRHEVGHNMGAQHDPASCTAGKPIMGGNSKMAWSSCSKTAIESHYANYRWRWCMPENPAACRGMG